jgi:general secretion pathway protein J
MKGFTLVEMLVALLVFGLLAAAGVAVMSSTVRNQAAVRSRTEALGELQRLRAIMKSDLGQAALRRTRGPSGDRDPLAFAGAARDGRLLGLVRRGRENADRAPRASLQYVEYRLIDGRLERSTRPALDGVVTEAPQILVDGVEQVEIGFFGQTQWRSSWDVPDRLPEAVQLDLSLAGLGRVSQLFLTSGAER